MPSHFSRVAARNLFPAAIATIGLVLGFGAAVTLVASIDAAQRGAFTYGTPERLFFVDFTRAAGNTQRLSMDHVEALRGNLSDGSSVGAYWDSLQVALEGEYAGPIQAVFVEPELLGLLEVPPLLGRLPSPSGDNECVISESVWIARLNGNRGVIGTSLAFSESRCTLVGVMPSSFFFPDPKSDVWLPLPQAAQKLEVRSQPNLLVIARLPSEEDRIALLTQLQSLSSASAGSLRPRIRPLPEVVTQDYRQALASLLVAVLAVLILSIINLAFFVKAICVQRRREIAIRLALGASTASMTVMVITFAVVVATPGALGGLLLAHLMLDALQNLRLPDLWWLQSVSITWPIIAALVVATGFVAAVAAVSALPYVMRTNVLGELIRPIGPYINPAGRGVIWSVVGQVACATATATFASICIQSYLGAISASWGFDPANLLIVETELPRGSETREARTLFIEDALRSLRSSTAFHVVAMGQGIPLRWKGWEIAKARFRDADTAIDVGLWRVSSDYFKALRVPLVAGREFTDAAPNEGGVILSAAAANQLCRNECVGQLVDILIGTAGDMRQPNPADRIRWVPYASRPWEVVGVVANYKIFGLEVESRPAMFVHHGVPGTTGGVRLRPTFLLRARHHGEADARRAVVATFGASNPDSKIVDIVSMDSLVSQALGVFGSRKLLAAVGGVTSGLAVLVAVSGIFAASTSIAIQRIREVAIRLAIGATPASVFLSVAGAVLRSALLGTGLGAVAAAAGVMYANTLLFGSTATKIAAGFVMLVILFAAVLILVAIAFAAPTRRRVLIKVLTD